MAAQRAVRVAGSCTIGVEPSVMSDAGRSYFRVYSPVDRADVHGVIRDAVERSGGEVLWSSPDDVAPLYLAVREPSGDVRGVLTYVFRATRRLTRNRPADEHRGQIRYGDVNSAFWRQSEHPLGLDPTGVDTTLVLAVDVEHEVIVSLEPAFYDPLPIGNSVYWKDEVTQTVASDGWLAWRHEKRQGKLRSRDRFPQAPFEARVAVAPSRFLDLVAFEHESRLLGHDTGMRVERGIELRDPAAPAGFAATSEFGLTGAELLELIKARFRLAVAVRGGVAEFHAQRQLGDDPAVRDVSPNEGDGTPDLFVTFSDGRRARVEVKNASPDRYANGDAKVEVQKTRASKGDPLSRWYTTDAFDVLAVCMHGPEGEWSFRFRWTRDLTLRDDGSGRITPMQRISDEWSTSIAGLLAE
jgi:hypothetical protein